MMEAISNSIIEETLRSYGIVLESGVADKIRAYISLLLRWNRTISLTTVTDPVEILKFHFGESVFAASVVNFEQSRLADVGSGAGFPGMPLAMIAADLNVTLIESNARKCAFLSEVVMELRLPNISVFRGRMEDFPSTFGSLNFIAARALGQHDELLAWAKEKLSSDGKVILWLGEADCREVSLNSAWLWEPRKLIPGSERRYLLVGSRMSSEPSELFHVEHSSVSHSRNVPRETSCATRKLSDTFALHPGGFAWHELLPSPTKRVALEKPPQPLISVPLSPLPRSTPSSLTLIRRETPQAHSVSPRIPLAVRSIRP
jgi:16S rRNA (guanine527-N7)-methyltransferase